MMDEQLVMDEAPLMRKTAWSTLSSGIIGLVAIGCLVAAVTTRSTWSLTSRVYLLFRAHDIGVVLQFLLLVPLALGLRKLSHENPPGLSSRAVVWGISAISLVAVLLLLGVGKVVNDMAYMLPQGIFGAWLIFVNSRLAGRPPRWLRVFGMTVGFGLLLVGTVFPGLATFVYPNMWKIPAVPIDNDTFRNTCVNRAIHLILAIGSLLGVGMLPIWTLLTGLNLVRRRFES